MTESDDDLRRELDKALDTLLAVRRYLARHAEMNAALHCATRVMYSPLHARVESAVTGAQQALARYGPRTGGIVHGPLLLDSDGQPARPPGRPAPLFRGHDGSELSIPADEQGE